LSKDEVIEILTNFRGIRRWTAKYIAARGLKLPVIPKDDLGVRRTISMFYYNGRSVGESEVSSFEEAFGNYASVAIFYLLVAMRRGIKV